MALSRKQRSISPLRSVSSEILYEPRSSRQCYSVQPATRDSSLLGILLRDEYPRLKHRNRLVPSGTPLVGPVAYQCTTRIEVLVSKMQVCMAVALYEVEALRQVSHLRLGWQ